jgi:hypothetical protein
MYRVSGKPIELNILTPTPQAPMGWQNALEFCRESFRQGVRMHPAVHDQQARAASEARRHLRVRRDAAWREVLTTAEPERSRALADPRGARSSRPSGTTTRRAPSAFDLGELEVEGVRDAANAAWVGRTIAELGAERGRGSSTRSSTCRSRRISRRASARA